MLIETIRVIESLSAVGLLLQQDKVLPSVIAIVTEETLSSSWWSHPKGRLIFSVLTELSGHPKVLFTKLLHGKVTLVHRKLWPSFLAVAQAREPWQLADLSPGSAALLRELDQASGPLRCSGLQAKELELKLLAHAEQVHTESGHHELSLERWSTWSRRTGVRASRSLRRSKQQLESATLNLGAPISELPWLPGKGAAS